MKIEYFDTHAHIHFPDYGLDPEETWRSAQEAGVTRMMAVGCRLEDSKGAVRLAAKHDGIWAAVGVHPHEATKFLKNEEKVRFESLLNPSGQSKIVAVGECGLDYYYENSSKEDQKEVFEFQLGLAEKHNLPVIFHIRDAFDDFWPIYDKFNIKKGVLHSFTGLDEDVKEALKRDLYIGLNGIMTFTKVPEQLEAAKSIPLEKIVIETDAPFLTPKPFRGKICKPEHVKLTAAFLAELRGEELEHFARQTTMNAQALFDVK